MNSSNKKTLSAQSEDITENPMVIQDRNLNTNVVILIAEDSHTQAAHLKRTLEKYHYKVNVAYDGSEAFKEIKKKKPTIVISDVLMPGLDGYELCRKIKSDNQLRSIPVILLTQLSDPKDIVKGLECEADHFITKPYNEDFLISHIRYVLVNRELRTNAMAEMGIEIFFAGQKHFITSDRMQILDLLFSTYEAVLHKNKELEKANQELKISLETIQRLKGLIPICSHCKKIRNDEGYWQQLEVFIREHSDAEFTHGLCPDCEREIYSLYLDKFREEEPE
jgi:two-component system response regulator VanR